MNDILSEKALAITYPKFMIIEGNYQGKPDFPFSANETILHSPAKGGGDKTPPGINGRCCLEFFMLPLAAGDYYPQLDGARAKQNSTDKNKRKVMKAILLLSGAVISLLLWSPAVRAQGMERNNPIYKELAEQGRMTTGQIISVYGVPCVEVMLNSGETINTFVLSISSLKKKSIMVEDRIALINKTHYILVVHGEGNVSTGVDKMFVPLDYSIEPKILPEVLPEAANHEKYLLLDLRQQYLGLYEWGNLKYTFPVSSGTSNSPPFKKFVVSNMDEVHYSTKYEMAPMDHALHIGLDYFIHEGIVPGYPASHGCIRIFPLDARFLFYQWAKPGVPGEIIGRGGGRHKLSSVQKPESLP